MRTLKEITEAISRLSDAELAELRAWLFGHEDQLKMTDSFESQIKASERERAEGRRPRLR